MILKNTPEDFIVEELIELKFSDNGLYSYFLVGKKEQNTQEMADQIAKFLGNDKINFSGTKDKRAITKQHISVNYLLPAKRKDYDFGAVKLKYLGQGDERLNLGSHYGNKFRIVVRDLESEKEIQTENGNVKFVNYFGEQRFSKNNVEIGVALLKKNFKKAAEMILKDNKNYAKALEKVLEKEPNNYIGALQRLPKKYLSLLVNSVQSYMWNNCVKNLVESDESEKEKISSFPLIGFDYDNEQFEELVDNEMDQLQLKYKDFINRTMPFLTLECVDRSIFAEMKELKYEYDDDEIFEGKKKCVLEFTLDKGCYATVAIRSILE